MVKPVPTIVELGKFLASMTRFSHENEIYYTILVIKINTSYIRYGRNSSIKTQCSSEVVQQTEHKRLAVERFKPNVLRIDFCLQIQHQHATLCKMKEFLNQFFFFYCEGIQSITWGTEVSKALDNSGVQYAASLLNSHPCINL